MHRPDGIDRRVLFGVARCLYSARTVESPDRECVRRVLVVRVDERVGNLIALQSMLDALRSKLPDLDLGLLASINMGQVISSLQGVSRMHQLDKRWLFYRPLRWHRVIAAVRKVRYQVAIDASAWHEFSFTHAVLTYYSGAPITIGYNRAGSQRADQQDSQRGFHTYPVDPGPADEHELKQRIRLLAPLGIQMEPPVLRSGLGGSQKECWEQWLQSLGMGRPRIGIWAGSRKLERRWPMNFFARLASRLQRQSNASLVVLWGPGEECIRDRLVASLRFGREPTQPPLARWFDANSQNIAVAPSTNLAELAGILRRLDLVVTNDTGPMHLSVALGKPTLAVFASGEPKRWGYPYPFVKSLALPGSDPAEVSQALDACRRLLALCNRR